MLTSRSFSPPERRSRGGHRPVLRRARGTHLSPEERSLILKLMEMQRHTQLMYTSCGWFFDDISGIETVQMMAYAARALAWPPTFSASIARCSNGNSWSGCVRPNATAGSGKTAEIFTGAWSNRWRSTWNRWLRTMPSPLCSAAIPTKRSLFCYTVRRLDYENVTSGRARLAVGRCRITSNLTEETEEVSFAALHFGDHNVTAAVERSTPQDLDRLRRPEAEMQRGGHPGEFAGSGAPDR